MIETPAQKIRVLALGGCGGIGQFAVRTALGFDFVDEILIGDREEQRAREFAEKCGPKARSVGVNVLDEPALAMFAKGKIDRFAWAPKQASRPAQTSSGTARSLDLTGLF